MRGFHLLVLMAGLTLLAAPGKLEAGQVESGAKNPMEKVSVDQLEQALSIPSTKSDAQTAQALSALELTERLSTVRLTHLQAHLPGENSRQALLLLADQSIFLPTAPDEIEPAATPDAAATRQMLTRVVNYVNTTVRQLPNLMAVRETTAFQNRPREDRVDAVGTVSLGELPIHFVGRSDVAVTYRDRKEVEDQGATRALKSRASLGGLVTSGEFGPILTTVLADALKGRITWARWESGPNTRWAVFHYEVPGEKSNYKVKFCCIGGGFRGDGQAEQQVFDERAGYHGDIAFDPSDGTIERITLEAEMPAGGLVPRAGIAIEYSPVEIGGKSYTCPARSVSLLEAHTAAPKGMYSRANYQGAPKIYLNDVVFRDYRRFGSEVRILADESGAP